MQVARPGHQVSRRRHLRRRRRRRLDYWFSFRRRQQQKRRPPHFPFFFIAFSSFCSFCFYPIQGRICLVAPAAVAPPIHHVAQASKPPCFIVVRDERTS